MPRSPAKSKPRPTSEWQISRVAKKAIYLGKVEAEGRTIKTVEEMLEFCKAAVAASHADPATLRLHVPQDMRVAEIVRADGRKVFDVLVSPAA